MSRRKQSHPKPLKRTPEETCPDGLSITADSATVLTDTALVLGTRFGPYRARRVPHLPTTTADLDSFLQTETGDMIFHLEEEASHWLKFVTQAKCENEANFRVILEGGSLWGTTASDLPQGTILKAWFRQDGAVNGEVKMEPASPASTSRRSCSPEDSPPSGSVMDGGRKSSPSSSLAGSPVSPGCRSDPGINSRFTCDRCGVQYSTQSNLDAHQKFYCSRGRFAEGMVSPSRSEGRDGGVSDSRSKPYNCSLCPFTCERRTGLTRHLRAHDAAPSPEDAPSRYCSHCDIQFSSFRTYQVHKRFYCSTRHVQKPRSSGTRTPSPSSPVIVGQPLYAAISTNPLILVPCSYKPGGNGIGSPSLVLPGANSEVVPAFTVLPSSPPEPGDPSPPPIQTKKTPPVIKSPWSDRSIKVEPEENSRSCEPLDLSLRNKEDKEPSDSEEVSPQRPPLIISPNCAGPSLPVADQPRVIIKQGSSRCHDCNIVFYKYENYQVHKNFYCSSRQQKLKKCPSPKTPIKEESQDKENSSGSSQCRSPEDSETQAADSSDNRTPPLSTIPQMCQFFCTACGIKFTSLDNLQTHQSFYCPKRESREIVGNSREFRCNKCKVCYQDEETLIGHTCRKTWKCPYCDTVCHSFVSAQKHFQSHSTAGKVFRCTICGYKGHTLRGMRTHVRIHPEKGNLLPEESFILCTDEEFGATKRRLSQDESREASQSPIPGSSKEEPDAKRQCIEAVHSCQVCGYTSSYKGNVVRHVKLVHRDLTNVGNAIDSKPLDPQKSPPPMENGVDSSSSPEPQNEEVLKPGPPYCKTCDISFKYFNNFVAHKKFYCTKRTESVQ